MPRDLDVKSARMRLHTITLEDRARATISDVSDVESFNESEVMLMTSQGGLSITGEGLHISRLNLDEGQLVVEGLIAGVEYAAEHRQGGLFSRMFR